MPRSLLRTRCRSSAASFRTGHLRAISPPTKRSN
jgi:hypothetical protein